MTPPRYDIHAARREVAYARGQIADARTVSVESARLALDWVDQLLNVIDEYQRERKAT
ncbi:hypothetical protein [Nocardia wallacei]|uniref:hypothetical protein n=1 Tax=Nocardia wallacei TaxID=480035 RepID=UPI002455CDF9|nr:hypothetical protein [Nocardia wallacei]